MLYAPHYPIETERLRLRPFSRGDVDAVFAYRQREDVAQYLFDGPMSHESVTEVVQHRIGQYGFDTESAKVFLAVELRHTQQVIGEVSLILRDAAARQAEIGYIFHPEFHGQGFATEAARILLQMGFEGAGMHRIYARCDARNASSWKVMERLGMRREAHFREHALFKGGWDEEFVYALLEQEWRADAGS